MIDNTRSGDPNLKLSGAPARHCSRQAASPRRSGQLPAAPFLCCSARSVSGAPGSPASRYSQGLIGPYCLPLLSSALFVAAACCSGVAAPR